MEVKIIKIDDLKFAEYNPRQISTAQFEHLRTSIREFGFVEPNVINSHPGRENVIVGGHMRTRAAKAEGMSEVPCILVNLDPIKEKLLNIALNAITGSWDTQKLAEMVFKLNEDGANIKLTGFEDEQIKLLLEDGVLRKPEEVEGMGLPKGGKGGFQQMTFTLTDAQAEQVKAALDKANAVGKYEETGNGNSNGNALARVCEMFNGTPAV